MKSFLTILAATAASAAVAAAITLPAGASDEPTTPSTKDARFVTCLRDHGLAIPADTSGDAIKGWLLAHDGVEAAVQACKPRDAGGDKKVTEITACLRAQGLNPPADIDQLKPWIAEHGEEAGVKACGFDAPIKTDHGDKGAGLCAAPQPAKAAAKRADT